MPSTATDRLNGLTTSVAVKPPCRIATTGNITLSGEQTVNGVAVVTGDRVLVKDQTDTTQNGIYVANTSAWSRAPDFDGSLDAVNGTVVLVTSDDNAAYHYKLVATDPVVIGTTSLTFEPALVVSAASSEFLQAGTGAVARSSQSKMRDMVSVLDFGATGDGTTDDTDAIQAAIDTGKGVYFPDAAVHYVITSTLTISTAGQKLMFQSRNAKIRPDADTFDAITVAASFVEIHNGTLQGRATGTSSTTAGIRITACTRGVFNFTRVEGFGYGVRMQSGTSGNWSNTFFKLYLFSNKRAGFYGCGHATSVLDCEIAGSVYGIIQATLQVGTDLAIDRDNTGVIGQGVRVSGCTIQGIQTNKTITGAADNGAGLIRITAAGHGWQTGDSISIDSVTGTTEANGVWPITRIDADTFDLKTSTFTNAYVSGGTARRGVGVYVSVGQMAPSVTDCYFEEVPVVMHLGDSYKNDGATALTTNVLGGLLERCYVGNTYESAAVVANRVVNFGIYNPYASGTKAVLINSRDANLAPVIQFWGDQGFARTFETTGSTSGTNLVLKPATKNGGNVLRVQVPTSASDQTLIDAFSVSGVGTSSAVVRAHQSMQFDEQMRFGSGSPPSLNWGSGTPEGVLTAFIGSIYLRTDGGAGTSIYIKESGTGNTGWVAK